MKITKTDIKSLMEMAGVPMDSPKVQKLIEMEKQEAELADDIDKDVTTEKGDSVEK